MCDTVGFQRIVGMEMTVHSHVLTKHTVKESHIQLRIHRSGPLPAHEPPIEDHLRFVFESPWFKVDVQMVDARAERPLVAALIVLLSQLNLCTYVR